MQIVSVSGAVDEEQGDYSQRRALNRRDPIVLELSLCYSGGIQLIARKKKRQLSPTSTSHTKQGAHNGRGLFASFFKTCGGQKVRRHFDSIE
jgi:hypothetical protein